MNESITLADKRLLMAEMKRFSEGEIMQAVKLADFSPDAQELGAELEKLRQFVNSFIGELQVTNAQVSSAVEQIQDGLVRTEAFADTFKHLQTQSTEVDILLQTMDNRLVSAEQELEEVGRSFLKMDSSTRSINSMVSETTHKLEELSPVIMNLTNIIDEMDNVTKRVRMLSFNAAIEAAHAAEMGRGFAVVAQEMKNLADQSSNGVSSSVRVLKFIEGEIITANIGVSQKENEIQIMLAEMQKETSHSFILLQELMSSFIKDTRSVREEINNLLKQVIDNFKLWELANEKMQSSSTFLQRIGESQNLSLQKIAASNTGSLVIETQTMEDILIKLGELSALDDIVTLQAEVHRKILGQVLNFYPGMEAIYSNRADGSFIFSEPPAALANARARQWWQEAIKGYHYKSPVYVSAITRQACITVAIPILNQEGKPCGVLAADLTVK